MKISRKKPGQKPHNIRNQNKKLILKLYHEYDKLSVTEISKMAGLSRTTVMKVVQELLHIGLLIESGKRQHNDSGGKKPNIYQFNSGKKLIITIYIQYEDIKLRVYDLKYKVLLNDTEKMSKSSQFDNVLQKIQKMVNRSIFENVNIAECDFLSCIIGLHGNIDQTTGVCLQATHFHSWGRNQNIRKILNDNLGLSCPIFVDNWIRLKTFGEKRVGSVEKYDSTLLIDAGWHGVGVGIIQNGEVYQGNHFIAGEIGHFKLNYEDDEECFCGSCGCFEQQILIERLRKQAGALESLNPGSLLAGKADQLDYRTIFAAADSGDVIGCKIIDSVIHWFSLAISYLMLFYDPEVLFLEGDYALGCKYFEEGLEREIKKITLPRIERDLDIRYSRNGVDSVLFGAAVFAFEHYFITSIENKSIGDAY